MSEVIVRLKPTDKLSVINIPDWDNVEADIKQKLRKVIEENTYIDQKQGGEYGYEVFIDKRDGVFSNYSLADISKEGIKVGTDQYDYLNENYTYEWEMQTKDDREDEICKAFRTEYPNEFEDYKDEIREVIRDLIYAYTNPDDLNQEIDVAIALDVGDSNYDFDTNNVFNSWDSENKLNPLSPVAWLAKTQGRLTDLKKAISEINNGSYKKENHGKFVDSCINEFLNQYNCMSCMIFLVRMGLNDYIKL